MTSLPPVEACGGIAQSVTTRTDVTKKRQGTLW